jgi:hypothetical protein
MLASGSPEATLGVRLVVTTPSRSMESEREVRQMLPPGMELEMSSEAWFRYAVTKAPSFVLLRNRRPEQGEPPGATETLGPLSASTPAELVGLVRGWRNEFASARPREPHRER